MAIYRQLHTSFWQDSFVLSLTPEQKFFFIYLLTNSKTKQCGIYELPIRVAEMETGYNRETIEKLIINFINDGKIVYDWATSEVAIKNWLKYNPDNNPKIRQCIEKELKSVKNKKLVAYVYDTPQDNQSVTIPANIEMSMEEPKKKNPDKEEVVEWFLEKGQVSESEKFFNYYESNGWMVGKNKMKNWKSAASNWLINKDKYQNEKRTSKTDFKSASEQYQFTQYGDITSGQIFESSWEGEKTS